MHSCLGRTESGVGGLEGAPQAPSQWSPPPPAPLHFSPGFQSREHLLPAPPPAQPGFCLDPATLPPPPQGCLPACLPAAPSSSFVPWLWPRRAWRGSQAPHRSGQSSGQSQSVWQGCEFRIGWRCPAFGRRELWGEAGGWVAHSRSPSFPLPASLFNSCPFCLTLRREEAGCLTGRRQRSPGRRKALGAPGIYSSANTQCLLHARPGELRSNEHGGQSLPTAQRGDRQDINSHTNNVNVCP